MNISTRGRWLKEIYAQAEKNHTNDEALSFFMSAKTINRPEGKRIGKWFQVYEHNLMDSGDYREILPNEVVFDIDVQDWDKVKMYYKIITNGLTKLGIPYIPAKSGGKGIHIHIFINKDGSVTNDIIKDRDLRKFLAYMVLSYSRIWSKEVKDIIDVRKINPRPHSSLIRDFGGKKYYRKTLIQNETELNKRDTNVLMYPNNIRVWKVKDTEGVFFNMIDSMSAWWSERIKDEVSTVWKDGCVDCNVKLTTKYSFPADQCALCRWINGNNNSPNGYYLNRYTVGTNTVLHQFGEAKDLNRYANDTIIAPKEV